MQLSLAVRKSFGAFSLDVDVSLTGSRFGIFGPSGSGKSTLVSMLAGLQKPDNGEIVLDGERLFCSDSRTDIRPEKRRIALVFQQHGLFPHLSVKGNLLYGMK